MSPLGYSTSQDRQDEVTYIAGRLTRFNISLRWIR